MRLYFKATLRTEWRWHFMPRSALTTKPEICNTFSGAIIGCYIFIRSYLNDGSGVAGSCLL